MNFTSIRIKNFKAIEDTTLSEMAKFNVIVGTNGSGKSSALQALHWVLQSGRNPAIRQETGNRARTLSPSLSDYMPSPDYKNAGNKESYGNQQGMPQLDICLKANVNDDQGAPIETEANLWIRSAKNEGISVHIPSNNLLSTQIRDRRREISAYIPGLAGIPLSEAKLSKRVVHRQAAAGDANTVLRNLLYLLKSETGGSKHGANQLDDVLHWVSKVLKQLSLKVDFDDEKDFSIRASFKTGDMERNDQPDKPLELAGIGFLQVIQIFAYLIYYRPQLLLVDEPDSHLHPNRQEDLVRVLYDAAQEYDCQVIMTTHSPSVVRAMPPDAKLIWMKEGKVVDDLEGARALMGWGLLDKTVLLLSEDKNTDMLRKIISQWPEIDRKVAVWPLAGIKTLPSAGSLQGMNAVFGDTLIVALHRDGDFLTADERVRWSKSYIEKGIAVWTTEGSDVEAYFCSVDILTAYGFPEPDKILATAIDNIDDWEKKFRAKREDALRNNTIYSPGDGRPDIHAVIAELCFENHTRKYVGKTLVSKIRKELQDRSIAGASSYGKRVGDGDKVAPDLKVFLEELIH